MPPEGSKRGQASRPGKAPEVKNAPKSPYWNDDPRSWWLGPMNLSYAYIDGVWTRVLLDDGSQINSIMPAYAHEHNMVIGSLQELAWRSIRESHPGDGGMSDRRALSYVVFHIQIEDMKSYDEEQVALVIADDTKFGHRVPIILGTPTIHQVIRSMKESEMENASPEWERTQVAYEATNWLFSYRATCDALRKRN